MLRERGGRSWGDGLVPCEICWAAGWLESSTDLLWCQEGWVGLFTVWDGTGYVCLARLALAGFRIAGVVLPLRESHRAISRLYDEGRNQLVFRAAVHGGRG